MKADVQYNDFVGTAAADVADFLGAKFGDELESFAKYFKIDESRFTVIGVSIYGTNHFFISLLCVDKHKSNEDKEYIVSMSVNIDDHKEILDMLFKRMHIVLHSKYDNRHSELKYDEEVDYDDYHESENK